jgi:phosphoribosylformylglycinamidine synthase
MRDLVDGVVRGIGGYGNCIGVPTVGGMTFFHPAYDKNILVNAMAVGLVRQDRIFRAKAAGPGNPVLYAGSKTGRDGIHGASMASDVFDDEKAQRRPTVQVWVTRSWRSSSSRPSSRSFRATPSSPSRTWAPRG